MDMPSDAFLTALYTIVDDWYQAHAPRLLSGKRGCKPRFSDSEVITLSLAQHWLGFRSEREWLRFVRHHFRLLFPRLVCQSGFNRRARNLCWLCEQLRRFLIAQLGVEEQPERLVDSTPVHVRHWRRYSSRSLSFRGARLGFCASKREAFFGYRLVTLTTLAGIVTDWTLIPANADEREGAIDLLEEHRGLTILGDKGFLDAERQAQLKRHYDHDLIVAPRANQPEHWSRSEELAHNRKRQRIEVLYSQAKETFGLEKPRAHTTWGFFARVIAKLSGLTVAAWANSQRGRSPLALAHFSF